MLMGPCLASSASPQLVSPPSVAPQGPVRHLTGCVILGIRPTSLGLGFSNFQKEFIWANKSPFQNKEDNVKECAVVPATFKKKHVEWLIPSPSLGKGGGWERV